MVVWKRRKTQDARRKTQDARRKTQDARRKTQDANKIRVYFFHDFVNDIASLKNYWRYLDEDIISNLEWDDEDPEFVFATSRVYLNQELFNKFKELYLKDKSRIYILFGDEALEADLNIYDYALTFNGDLRDRDRICRIPPALFFNFHDENNFTHQDALNKIKNNNLKFCNFIYSNPNAHELRDKLFYKLSEYKRVDSLGPHLNNVNTKGSRNQGNWQQISIELKSNYKFSIAAENACFNGYTSEKLMTSLKAHTVPIYFGNPNIAKDFNPEAFINVNDYENLDALLAKIKEIDEDNELWAKIVSTPWRTEEHIKYYEQQVLNYKNFIKNIFDVNVPLADKKRLPVGTWASWYADWYFDNMPVQKQGLDLKLRQAARKILKFLGLLNYYDKKFK